MCLKISYFSEKKTNVGKGMTQTFKVGWGELQDMVNLYADFSWPQNKSCPDDYNGLCTLMRGAQALSEVFLVTRVTKDNFRWPKFLFWLQIQFWSFCATGEICENDENHKICITDCARLRSKMSNVHSISLNLVKLETTSSGQKNSWTLKINFGDLVGFDSLGKFLRVAKSHLSILNREQLQYGVYRHASRGFSYFIKMSLHYLKPGEISPDNSPWALRTSCLKLVRI